LLFEHVTVENAASIIDGLVGGTAKGQLGDPKQPFFARQMLVVRSNNGTFNFDVDIRIGAGAFVCGEETALMASIEGNRGQPHPRPPFPAERGLWGFPTLINNVEAFASVVPILERGPEWYATLGTDKSKGTKVFSLTGKIQNSGLIEVPMGITIREIVEEMGGGAPEGAQVKAIQTGGPSGVAFQRRFSTHPWTTNLWLASVRLWVREEWSSWTNTPTWSMSPAFICSSAWKSLVGNAFPAVSERWKCTSSNKNHRKARHSERPRANRMP
jgi:hypothetical protein